MAKVNDWGTAKSVRMVRDDGYPGAMLVPAGSIVFQSVAISGTATFAPPTPFCVSFLLVASAAGGRYTWDGVTTATASTGFPVATGGTPPMMPIKPGTSISFTNGGTATTINLQWFESV